MDECPDLTLSTHREQRHADGARFSAAEGLQVTRVTGHVGAHDAASGMAILSKKKVADFVSHNVGEGC